MWRTFLTPREVRSWSLFAKVKGAHQQISQWGHGMTAGRWFPWQPMQAWFWHRSTHLRQRTFPVTKVLVSGNVCHYVNMVFYVWNLGWMIKHRHCIVWGFRTKEWSQTLCFFSFRNKMMKNWHGEFQVSSSTQWMQNLTDVRSLSSKTRIEHWHTPTLCCFWFQGEMIQLSVWFEFQH